MLDYVGVVWARRSDGVEVGLRAFEATHPSAMLAGAWAVVVRPGPGREYVVFGPASEVDARAVARAVWEDRWPPTRASEKETSP